MKTKLWNRDFTMVVIGQIISLFGNAILRLALPLYLLSQTGSAALFGLVSACAFIPMILLAPIGGIFADRVNKRNIIVILDFSTAALVTVLSVLLGRVNIVTLLLTVLIILYGIQGAYQPSVQASIPALLSGDNIMQGNAIINLVSSISGLLGPVIGGTLYGFFGIMPILYVSIACFIFSAVMEIFIHIPFVKKKANGSIISIGIQDLKDSFHYMKNDEPMIMKISFIIAGINLVLSSLMIIGTPIIVTQILDFEPNTASRLYGYVQGFVAMGSLAGGILAGTLSKKLKAKNSYREILYCGFTLIPIAIALLIPMNAYLAYGIITLSSFVMMLFAALFSVQMMAYLQMIVPEHLLGKIISCAMCVGMCASPLGQAIYGGLFQVMSNKLYIIIAAAAICTGAIAISSKGLFHKMQDVLDRNEVNMEENAA